MSKSTIQRHVKNDKIKWILTSVAFFLIAAMIAIICLQVFGTGKWKPSEWFKKNDTVQTVPDDGNGLYIPDEGNAGTQGVKMSARRLASTEYAAYGVSAQADSAYEVTVAVEPADATVAVDITGAWQDDTSAWATGKQFTDYLTITHEDGAMTAVLECSQAFGEPISLTAALRSEPDTKVTVPVHYVQRTLGYKLILQNKRNNITFNSATGETTKSYVLDFQDYEQATTYSLNVVKSDVYTKENDDKASTYFIGETTEFSGLGYQWKSYMGSGVENFFEKDFFARWGDQTAATYNKLIDDLAGFTGTAYQITILGKDAIDTVATFNLTFDTSVIVGQKRGEGISLIGPDGQPITEIIF